jgi:leucyl/phenylalanyl-tRNA--protein transferase
MSASADAPRAGGTPTRFPDPRSSPSDAPLARGGDLEPDTLVDAYAHGIFPWPGADGEVYWWSPSPRAVFAPPDAIHVSRSLARVLRSGRFRVSTDRAFAAVMRACGHRPGEGTWITPELRAAYVRLHRLGIAHSLEVWDADERLVGGIYGVALGGAFMGESMFHRVPDASKVALVRLGAHLAARGFTLLDAQLPTDHLTRMGVQVWSREEYLRLLERVVDRPCSFA